MALRENVPVEGPIAKIADGPYLSLKLTLDRSAPIMKHRSTFAGLCSILATAIFVAGCTNGTPATMTRSYISTNLSPSLIAAGSRYDGVKLEVVGNPFEASQDTVDSRILDAMRQIYPLANIPLTVGEADPESPYRMVILFNADPRLTHRQVCQGRRDRTDTPGATVKMMLAYCLSEDTISSLWAEQRGIRSPADPKFQQFIRNTARAAFPSGAYIRGNGQPDNGSFP